MKMNTVKTKFAGAWALAGAAVCLFAAAEARGEAILQVFNQSHNEIAERLPEIAEAGYTALWVPPPTKGNGGMSVGYDLNDPFDIGNSDLCGTWSTRYGVEGDLHHLIEMCHRFGLRVYFDNVMNHRSYAVPCENESTPWNVYPGMCPEDFHVEVTSEGFYRKWPNVDNWQDEWQVMFRGLSGLLDIAHETPNQNFGTPGGWHDKPSFVRHPDRPDLYDWDPEGNDIGFGEDNGLTAEDIAAHPDAYREDVGGYLCRAVRWLVDRTRVDGLRLDAVKHVPYYFFGVEGDDASDAGYVGQVQKQFNKTRGYNDWNHRDSVFNADMARDDAMIFGEHLGFPPPQGPYVSAGMRLVDDRLRNELNWRFSANQLDGFDGENAGSELGANCGVMHAQSHDNDIVDRKPLHHAMYFMRRGLGLVYSDGNNHAATLSGSGGAFPRWAQTDFLGQWGQRQIPTLLHAHENFARDGQYPKWSQGNFIAFQRGGEGSWATMLFQLNSGWDFYQDSTKCGDYGSDDFYLYDYAIDMYMPHRHDEGWSEAPYVYGSELATGYVELPPNSYAIWSWKNPDPSRLYPSPYPECFVTDDDRIIAPDSRVITVMEDGKVVEPVWVTRKDGVDGDPDFNPYGVADTNATDFSYTIALPRVTKGTNVTLAIKADGSTGDVKLRLDGGMDFGNGISNEKNGDWRDAAPGMSEDFWLGFEAMKDEWFRHRTWPEKFAAADTANCHIGSAGARTYEVTVGSAPAAGEDGEAGGGPDMNVPLFAYHDPTAKTPRVPVPTGRTLVATNTYAALASVNGQGGADGFGDWVESSWNGDADGRAGWFLHDNVEATGLTGFTGGQAWGLWAKFTEGSWPNAQVTRSFTRAGTGLKSAGVDVGMKFDSNIEGSFKGVEFTDASGSPVFGVQMQNSPVVTYYGAGGASGVWSENYSAGDGQEPKVFKVELARTATGYEVTGTTRDGGTFGPLAIATDADIAGFKAYMNGVTNDAATDNRQLYFDNLRYAAVETAEETEEKEVQQFQTTAQGARVWLNTSAEETDLAAFLYYTTDGDSWPEGAGGVPSNTKTKALEGTWAGNAENGSWWRFEIPKSDIPDGTKLRYKASCAHAAARTGFTVWPGGPDQIAEKKNMMTLWMVPGLDFTTQQYHKHLDYTSWTTGFKDGWHLATARVFLNRNDGAPVPNTFRQTFYLDLHVPDGEWMYPANDGEEVGGNEYGMVVRTDQTVDEVWYHIDDINPYNDGPGNGTTTNGTVEWAQADRVSAWSKEMATNTVLPRVWRFTYKGIAAKGSNATIRVRLREVSSVPADQWVEGQTPEELHVKELTRTVKANGPDYYMYWDWPTQANEMVQSGWNLRLKVSPNFASGMLGEEAKGLFTLTVQPSGSEGEESKTTVAGASTNAQFEWHWPNDSELLFAMPNVYTGNEADTHDVKITGSWESGAGTVTLVATNIVRTKGPLMPTCIVTMPPETDSDGVKWVITMEDSTAAREGGRETYETPIVVLTDAEAKKLELAFKSPEGYGAAISATQETRPENEALRLVDVTGKGSSREWTFAWFATNAGTYRFEAKVTVDNRDGKWSTDTNSTVRTATVQFRQNVEKGDESDADWDDDGISNETETAQVPLPERTAETWTQAEVFANKSSGAFNPLCVDADGDGLPDGLEVGLRVPADGTDTGADLNGDGWPNFIWDRDPPFYNTLDNEGKVPLVNNRDEGGDRAKQLWGSVTDPLKPDSDGDGLPDGTEDANRNGWADGDGETIGAEWLPWKERNWPDGKMDGETWEETSAVLWDSDADGLSDGYGEDSNLNGWTDMELKNGDGSSVLLTPADYEAMGIGVDAHSRANSSSTQEPKPWTSRAIDYKALFAAYNVTDPEGNGSKQTDGWPRLVITETDPLCKDTDHDGLPDGWESQYGLDPLNNGVYDFRTGQWTDDPTHGPKGNPDGDAYDNATECARNTNPRAWDDDGSGGGGGGEGMNIGPGPALGRVNDTTYYTDGTEWTLDDLIALDDYNQAGDIPGQNRSDIFRIYGSEYNASRDIVAFYFRDGGAEDGKLYFRVDLDDLKTGAEAFDLNLYVAINTGRYGEGVKAFPEDVNCNTEMGWNALTAVYDAENGSVYRQVGDSQSFENVAGFLGAHFDAANDFVAWAVDRKALLGEGWVGGTDTLKFQVYTTRDFTDDSGGGGDKSGRNDFMDTIGDDWLCSDADSDWNYVANHPLYSTCVSRNGGDGAWNNRGRHVKLALVAHGNQAIEGGSTIQGLVNNGAGGGYWRPVAIHNIFTNCPLNLHVTPTLAIALQWAEAGTEKTWFSGPAVNASIKKGVASGALALLGSTYSDHIAPYFADDFNKENAKMARDVLNAFYGDGVHDAVSTNVLWTPERVADGKWLGKVSQLLGYPATIIDQSPHLREWFGLQNSLGGNAYKLQNYWIDTGAADWANTKAFALATTANDFRYRATDNGLNTDIRHLLLRRARTGQGTPIASLFYGWEDFADTGKADAYDQSLRWIANHPWVQVVTFDQALADPELTKDDNTHKVDVPDPSKLTQASQEWVHHACNGNYDNWFNGSWRHESLSAKTNEIRFHEYMPTPWGTSTNGVLKLSWDAVKKIKNAQVKALAEATIFASAFETGFHEEYNNELSRWAYGDYCSEANGWYWDEWTKSWEWKSMGLMSMAWRAQSRTRLAAAYAAVDEWAGKNTGLEAFAKDVDLDGEEEWILRNDSVMALFEAEGGVMVGAWFKQGTNVWQMVGNFAAQPETGYETQSAGTDSTRGTAMKDIKVGDGDMAAAAYRVTAGTGTLTFKSGDVTKTVTLADADAAEFQVSYDASGKALTVRNGLSPDLATLMVGGQGRLGETAGANELCLTTTGGQNAVSATIRVTAGSIDNAATDQPKDGGWNTVNLRNAPQVRQVDVKGTGSLAYAIAFASEEAQHNPPKMTITPADDQTVAVGGTVSVRVSAIDWKGDSLPVEATLPQGMAGQASWDAASGTLSWTVKALSGGGRTNDWSGTVAFSAEDEYGTAGGEVNITVPWDADENGVSDDWEWLNFRNDEKYDRENPEQDSDNDGFSNYAEWVAGTDPNDEWKYIAWESQVIEGTNVTLTFRSVAGAPYQIEETDAHGLLATNWVPRGEIITGQGETTTWTGERPGGESRMYRIRVPFFER